MRAVPRGVTSSSLGKGGFGLGTGVFSHCSFHFRGWLDSLTVLEKHVVKTSGKQAGSASRANQRLCVPVVLLMVQTLSILKHMSTKTWALMCISHY